jgi:small subunit ribosomal protein S20
MGTFHACIGQFPSAIYEQSIRRPVLPNVKSAIKRMRTAAKRAERNKAQRSKLRTAVKKARQAESAEEVNASLLQATSLLDRAARTRLVHPNKAARLKSRLAKRANAIGTA